MNSIQIVGYNNPKVTANAVLSTLLYAPKPFEVLVLENGSGEAVHGLLEILNPICPKIFDERGLGPETVKFVHSGVNHGYSGGHNFLGTLMDPNTKFIFTLNNDMFFTPGSFEVLLATMSNPEIGLACCTLINGTHFNKDAPTVEDIYAFAHFAEPLKPSGKLATDSNQPYVIRAETWAKLCGVDVWEDKVLSFNQHCGPYDESIDPHLGGWYADWDFYNRLQSLGLKTVVVQDALGYHYDHTTLRIFDSNIPGWVDKAAKNYKAKYGQLEKNLPVVKKPLPIDYPER